LDRDQLHFSEVIVKQISDTAKEFAPIIRNILDQLANAGGHVSSPYFDQSGSFTLTI